MQAIRTTEKTSPDYALVHSYAQEMANKLGRETGVEKLREFGCTVYNCILLPNPENRQGHELRCEIVYPATAKGSQPNQSASRDEGQIEKIVMAVMKEFEADAKKEIIDCQTLADTGRGVSKTELDNVPTVFEELARLEDTSPYKLGNLHNWNLNGGSAAQQIAAHRISLERPEIDFQSALTLVEAI